MEKIRVAKRGEKLRASVVRFSIGRESSGTGPRCSGAHALANPFKVAPHGPYSREQSISRYTTWLEHKIAGKDKGVCAALNEIWTAAKQGQVELECFCKPLACHGDVVKQVVEEKL